MKITILGAGTWGTTLACLLAQKGLSVTLWCRSEIAAGEINAFHWNSRYLGEFPLPDSIRATAVLKEAVKEAELLVVAVAVSGIRPLIEQVKEWVSGVPVVSLSKGLEDGTFATMTEVMAEYLPSCPLAALSGPNIAREILQGLPTSSVIASKEIKMTEFLQRLFNTSNFRVYTNQDVIGVEVAGAVKNIIAIAAGVAEGLKLGDNAKAALITRSLAEMGRLIQFKGGAPQTLMGLAGIGDLIVTCYSPYSRNHRVGLGLAEGKSLKTILAELGSVAEGVFTVRSVYHLAQEKQISMPITEQVFRVIYEGLSPLQALKELMGRELKEELV